MHQDRRVGPECVIEPMRQHGQRLQKLSFDGRVGPPREEPHVHQPTRPYWVPAEESEHLRGGTEQVAESRRAQKDRPVIVVVENPADAEDGRSKQNGQYPRERREMPVPEHALRPRHQSLKPAV